MARSFVLGNGSMLVCLDQHGQVRDLYYPHVGQENHVNGAIHRIGVWVDGQFSWLSDGGWQHTHTYQHESMVTNIVANNNALGIELHCVDAVAHDTNTFIRSITIKNKRPQKRTVRLFMHQHFQMYETSIGDTVFYNPFCHAIVNYKIKRYFLTNGGIGNGKTFKSGFQDYATGLVGEYGMQGTYVDAQDGTLSKNPIEHGSVDSTIGFHATIPGNRSKTIYYWICAGKEHNEVSALNNSVIDRHPQQILDETKQHWRTWSNRTAFDFFDLPQPVVDLFKRSLLIIKAHVDAEGGVIASSDSAVLHLRKDTYSYVWPRDGALIARSLDRAGYTDITDDFFSFCARTITPYGYLQHKYWPDGSVGSSWHAWLKGDETQLPIQEDEIALVIDALWKHFVQSGKRPFIKKLLDPVIRRAADFMTSFMDTKLGLPKESYDLWEEKLGIHTFTCATVHAGLRAAVRFEEEFGTKTRASKYQKTADTIKKNIVKHLYDQDAGYFIKGLYYRNGTLHKDTTFDSSSCYGAFQFGGIDVHDDMITSSFKHLLKKLSCETMACGYARYENDDYYRVPCCTGPGNPWFVTTLWLAEYYIRRARTKKDLEPAVKLFTWVVEHALSTGILSEQLDPTNGQQISVAPLTWSHAGFVIAVNKYLEKLDELGICQMCNPPKFNKTRKTK